MTPRRRGGRFGEPVTSRKARVTLPFMSGPREVPDEPPPFLGTWKRVYIGVLIYLCLIIALCWGFARALE